MTRIRAVAGAHIAAVTPKRPRFADVWSHYPVRMGAADVYALIGGEVAALYKANPIAYENACALRLSRAFNYGGLTITKKSAGYKIKGADGKAYMLRVNDMIKFVKANFGAPEIKVTPGGVDKSADFAGKNGVLVFQVTGWGNATGHVTLWNGADCGDHCYFVHDQVGPKTTEIMFWELK